MDEAKKVMSKKAKIIIGVVAAVVLGLLIWWGVAILSHFTMVDYSVIQAEYGIDISYDGKEILTIDGYTDCYYSLELYKEDVEEEVSHFLLYMTKDGEYVEWKVDLKGELLEERVLTKAEYDKEIKSDYLEKAVSAKDSVKHEAKVD